MKQEVTNAFAAMMQTANEGLTDNLKKNGLHKKMITENVMKAAAASDDSDATPAPPPAAPKPPAAAKILAPIPAPMPTPKPAAALASFTIRYNEGREQFDGTVLTNWIDAQDILKAIGTPDIGYNKTGIVIKWDNGREFHGRIDIGTSIGDFNPAAETIGEYLKPLAQFDIDRDAITFEDDNETKRAALQRQYEAYLKQQQKDAAQAGQETAVEILPTPAPLQYFDYSEKAFAVIGDTKPIKEQLKQLGGRYNPALKCGAGWIFSKKRTDAVKKALSL